MIPKTFFIQHLTTILLHATSLYLHCLASKPEDERTIAINCFTNKQHDNDYSIDYKDSFYNMITKHEAFIDKSLFIQDILTSAHNVLFTTCPPGFGKTVNLNMLKNFLKMEVYDNGTAMPLNSTIHYQLFKQGQLPTKDKILHLNQKLLISNNDYLIENTLGRYPVVHINFEGFQAKSRENYFTNFKNVIAKSFLEHKYMLNALQQQINDNPDALLEADLEKFKKYLNADILDKELDDSIRFLCGILHIHFKSHIVILVDEMELPIRKLIFSSNTSSFKDDAIRLHGNILRGALKSNPFLHKGLLSGVLPMTFRDGFFLLDDFVRYEFPDNDYVDKYYGFSETELEFLFDHYEIEKKQRYEAKLYYMGYEHKNHPHKKYFSPLCIMKFLHEKQLRPYFIEPTSLRVFKKFKKTGIFVELFANLMVRKSHKEYLFLLPPQDPTKLFQIVNDYENLNATVTPRSTHKTVVTDFLEAMIRYMLAHGYIAWCRHKGNTALRIPNEDVYSIMKNELYHYFESITINDGDAWRARIGAQNAWNEFLASSDVSLPTIKNLQIILKQFFNTQPEPVTSLSVLFFPDIITYRDTNYLELAITTLMKPNGTTFLSTDIFDNFKYPGLTTEKKFAPDIILLHDKSNLTRTSAIIEFKSKGELVKALEQAEWYEVAYKFRPEFSTVTQLKYVACWVTDNREVNLASAVIPTNWHKNNPFFNVSRKCDV